MGKFLSALEKYKLIEKEAPQMPSFENAGQSIEEAASSPEDKREPLENSETDFDSSLQDTLDTSEPLISYDKPLNLEEIYGYFGLNNLAATDTVFVLEKLINALPNELPEYVKKTTLDNILIASSMNLEKLLTDGVNRYNHLDQFINEYVTQNSADITALKKEIDKLTALISDYHQQIKQKESMVQQQISLIKAEEERIQSILTFFEK